MFLLVTLAATIFNPGAILNSDGQQVYDVADSIVNDGALTIPCGVGLRGDGELCYSKYGIGAILLAVPAVAIAEVATLGRDSGRVGEFLASMSMGLIVACLAVLTAKLSSRFGARPRFTWLLGLTAVVGTFVYTYSNIYFSELPLAVCFTGTVLALVDRRMLLAGALCGAAILIKQQALVVVSLLVLVVIVFRLRKSRNWQSALREVAPIVMLSAAAVAALLAYNVIRFGTLLDSGYQLGGEVRLQNPLRGLIGFLFSPAKSLLLFAPIVILSAIGVGHLVRRQIEGGWLALSVLVGSLATVAPLTLWHGDYTWGPRFLLPAVPVLVAAVGAVPESARLRRTVMGLAFAGFLMSAATLVVPIQAQTLDGARGPGILRQVQLVPEVVRATSKDALGPYPEDEGAHRRFMQPWQFTLARSYGLRGAIVSVGGTLVLLAGALLVARQLRWKAPRADPAGRPRVD